jgi:hypothetical protein
MAAVVGKLSNPKMIVMNEGEIEQFYIYIIQINNWVL